MLADLTATSSKSVSRARCDRRRRRVSAIRGQLGIGFSSRTFSERWIVMSTPGDSRMAGRQTAFPTTCGPPGGRLPTARTPSLEFPMRRGRTTGSCSTRTPSGKILNHQGITWDDVEIPGSSPATATMSRGLLTGGGSAGVPGDAAHAMPPWIGGGMCAAAGTSPTCAGSRSGRAVRNRPSGANTHQAERFPHVKEVTNRAVGLARSSSIAIPCGPVRRHAFRTANKLPGLCAWLRNNRVAAATSTTTRGYWRAMATRQSAG